MSFINFKLDGAPRRSTPIPLAAAVSQTLPRWRDGHVQHESPREVPYREPSVEKLHSSSSDRPASKKRRMTDPRSNAACFACKNSKTRCDKLHSGREGKCHRCVRLDKECVLNPPKRLIPSVGGFPNQPVPLPTTREFHALQSQHGAPRCSSANYGGEGTTNSTLEAEASAAFLGRPPEACSSSLSSASIRIEKLNLKIDSILNRRRSEQVFHQYISKFAPICPMVVFPPGTSATLLRETKPLLFLSILGVASVGYCTIGEQKALAVEFRGYLAESVIVRGEKSLELVQALQVASLWYRATDRYTQMNLNQLAHMATTMAVDLGLDKIEVLGPVGKAQDSLIRVEAQRAWLGCFLLSASLSLILRRQSAITWTAKMDDYLTNLQRTEACPTDVFFTQLVTTEHLCHAIDKGLFLSDPSRSVSTRDPKTIKIIQSYQSRIQSSPLDQLNSIQHSLVHFGRFSSLMYAHELALHVNHNIDEFAAPFAVKSLRTCSFINAQDFDASQQSILQTFIVASRGLLDTFLGLSVPDMLALPHYLYGGRVIYAIVLLIKVHKAITTSATGSGDVIKAGDLRVEAYLEQLVVVAKLLIANDESNALSRAFLIMTQLRDWFYLHLSKKPSLADETYMMEEAPVRSNRDNRQNHTTLAPIGTPSASSVAELSECNAVREHSKQLDLPVSPLDELIHPAMTSCYLPAHSRSSSEANGRTAATDDWFWEFFNVEMLN